MWNFCQYWLLPVALALFFNILFLIPFFALFFYILIWVLDAQNFVLNNSWCHNFHKIKFGLALISIKFLKFGNRCLALWESFVFSEYKLEKVLSNSSWFIHSLKSLDIFDICDCSMLWLIVLNSSKVRYRSFLRNLETIL